MPLRIRNLRLPIELPESEIGAYLGRRLGLPQSDIAHWRLLKKSLDARNRDDLRFVYTILVELRDEAKNIPDAVSIRDAGTDVDTYSPDTFDDPPVGAASLRNRPVIVGTGPAGLLAGYYLAKRGYQPLLLERGQPVKERVPAIRDFDRGGPHDPENNYLFGEGGAGCFSDGKLTCRMSGPDVDWVLQSFVDCGGPASLMYEHRPHLGSNKLPMICRNLRRKIEAWGGEYRFQCALESLDIQEGRIVGLHTSSGYLQTDTVILGTGHSARDTFEMLHRLGVPMKQKAFQLGLRIEHPQANVNHWKYGRERYLDILGAADYSLVAKGQRDLYSFCMCAGGYVIPSVSEPGYICTNGMSNSRHDTEFANSGLMVTLEPHEFGSDHPLAGVELQRRFESIAFTLAGGDYRIPITWAKDFLARRSPTDDRIPSSYQRGVKPADLHAVLPEVVLNAIHHGLPILDKKWKGMFLKDATLVGPEMRGSSPVRLDRDPATRQSPAVAGLYPVGEGAGYAGGIISAAVDGLRSAREVVRTFAPLKEPRTQ
jgi:uncharacterized FAD-dependent dehydrogenase